MKELLSSLVQFLIPHYRHTWLAANIDEDGIAEPVCELGYVEHGESFDGVVYCPEFTWLGFAWGGGGECRFYDWPGPPEAWESVK